MVAKTSRSNAGSVAGMLNSKPARVAVFGAAGFIGSAVADAYEDAGHEVRRVTRRGGSGALAADMRDASAVREALRGAAIVIHAASYIGHDPDQCRKVNVDGTAALVNAAIAENIGRIIYISTAAVYGRGPFDGVAEGEVPIQPSSTLSSSRAEAERIVLDAGGMVVRPHLVLGVGDRWVGPGIFALTRATGGLVDDGEARHSVIEVSELARAVVALSEATAVPWQIFHAARTMPVSVRALFECLTGERADQPSVSLTSAQQLVSDSGSLNSALGLLAVDHVFDCASLAALYPVLHSPFILSGSARGWYHEAIRITVRQADRQRGTPSFSDE